MVIDGHAHAAGDFADVEKLVETLDRLGVDKVALCPGMKNNTSLWPLPNIPISAVKQHPLYSRYFINPGIRFSYNYVFRDRGDGNEFVYSFRDIQIESSKSIGQTLENLASRREWRLTSRDGISKGSNSIKYVPHSRLMALKSTSLRSLRGTTDYQYSSIYGLTMKLVEWRV